MMKQLLLMDEEYCREIHVVAFFQKKLLHTFISDDERCIICKVFANIFNLSTY